MASERALYTKGEDFVRCPSPGCPEKIRRVVPVSSRRAKAKTKASQGIQPVQNLRRLRRVQGQVERAYGDDLHGIQPMVTKSQGRNELIEDCDEQQFQNGNWDGIPSSTKLEAVMDYIKRWSKEAPGDKIIGMFSTLLYIVILLTGFSLHPLGQLRQNPRSDALRGAYRFFIPLWQHVARRARQCGFFVPSERRS